MVEAGDTCDNIVKSKGISLATLLVNNPNTGSDCFIRTGEVTKPPLLISLMCDWLVWTICRCFVSPTARFTPGAALSSLADAVGTIQW